MNEDPIQVYWHLDDRFYAGEIQIILNGGLHLVLYDYNDEEGLAIGQET